MLTQEQGEINQRRIFWFWGKISVLWWLLVIGVIVVQLPSFEHFLPIPIRGSTGLFVATFAIVMVSFVIQFICIAQVRRNLRRIDPARLGCQKCGYDLTGNTSGTCPECGKEVDAGADGPRPGSPSNKSENSALKK